MPLDLDATSIASTGLADEITTVVSQAAAAILAQDFAAMTRGVKADRSPVTAADYAAQSVLLAGLSRLVPDIPLVSEEAGMPTAEPGPVFVLIDPLDGTREFLAGRDEFTVNVALVRHGTPVFGCIAAPALGLVWRGTVGHGAERLALPAGGEARACRERTPIRTRRLPADDMVIAVSRSHFDPQTARLLAHFPDAERIACGSSLKFCRVAEGRVDLYPRLAPTREWDIAAGHAVVAAAGGSVVSPAGEPLVYGRANDGFRVPGFVALGDPAACDQIARLAGWSCARSKRPAHNRTHRLPSSQRAEEVMPKQRSTPDARPASVSEDDLRRIVGDIDDAKILDILALKPTAAELEEAAIWAAGDGDALARAGRPLTGITAQIVEILTADEEEPPPVR